MTCKKYYPPEAKLPINHPDEFLKLTDKEKLTLLNWIGSHISLKCNYNNRFSSYGLKHDFERDKAHGGFYVTNGAFKGAMICAGFEPSDERALNPSYCISNKSLFIKERGF